MITTEGLLTYTPAPFFIGRDVVVVIMEEKDLDHGMEPNVVTSEVEVFVKESNVAPMLVLELNDEFACEATMMTFMGKIIFFSAVTFSEKS